MKTSCVIPFNDSIPQITEGTEIGRITNIPANAIGVSYFVKFNLQSPDEHFTTALFLDQDTNASWVYSKDQRTVYFWGHRKPETVLLRAGPSLGIAEILKFDLKIIPFDANGKLIGVVKPEDMPVNGSVSDG